ncbi:unnamed protein product [Candidula unifasciata]|uniref:UspA domain-containing protein n=1 Tax=Candidula unifasciata TaxID=100452 RepID=A0A8S3ZGY9_9EUPU|nr:unnamed protein product [Candidula unifasciata]
MTNILVSLDSSPQSEYCLEFYIRCLHREGNNVFALYVGDYYGDVGVLEGPTPGRIQELVHEDKQKAAHIEAHVTQVFKDNNIQGTFHRVVGRDVWHAIIEFSKSIKADLIVVGSRGMGKIRRTILGSTSESVLHHSEVPVLICKYPHHSHSSHQH